MKERLEKFMKTEGLSPSRFAEIMGVQPSSISHILGGRNKPSFDFIEKLLLRFPKVNPDWLLLGKGTMYRSAHDPASVASPNPELNPATEVSSQTILQTASSLFDFPANSTAGETDKSNRAEPFPGKTDADEFQEAKPTTQMPDIDLPAGQFVSSLNTASQPKTSKRSQSSDPAGIVQAITNATDTTGIERIVIFYKDKTFSSYTPTV